jgi:hypothetical protein
MCVAGNLEDSSPSQSSPQSMTKPYSTINQQQQRNEKPVSPINAKSADVVPYTASCRITNQPANANQSMPVPTKNGFP